MTKKHFQSIASIVRDLKDSLDESTHMIVAQRFAAMCKAENPRFDEGRFYVACGIGEG